MVQHRLQIIYIFKLQHIYKTSSDNFIPPLLLLPLLTRCFIYNQLPFILQLLLNPTASLRCVLHWFGYFGQNQSIHLFLSQIVILVTYV